MLDGSTVGPYPVPKDGWMTQYVTEMWFDATTGKHYAAIVNQTNFARRLISF